MATPEEVPAVEPAAEPQQPRVMLRARFEAGEISAEQFARVSLVMNASDRLAARARWHVAGILQEHTARHEKPAEPATPHPEERKDVGGKSK